MTEPRYVDAAGQPLGFTVWIAVDGGPDEAVAWSEDYESADTYLGSELQFLHAHGMQAVGHVDEVTPESLEEEPGGELQPIIDRMESYGDDDFPMSVEYDTSYEDGEYNMVWPEDCHSDADPGL